MHKPDLPRFSHFDDWGLQPNPTAKPKKSKPAPAAREREPEPSQFQRRLLFIIQSALEAALEHMRNHFGRWLGGALVTAFVTVAGILGFGPERPADTSAQPTAPAEAPSWKPKVTLDVE